MILALVVLEFAFASAAIAQSEIQTETVRFHRGTTSATISGHLTGDEIIDYHLGARAGQRMHVLLDTNNPSNYFNVMPPGSTGEAIFIGSSEGNEWSGTLAEDGTYTVRIYLMRNAARRGEMARYMIEFGITGHGESAYDDGHAGMGDREPGMATPAMPANANASGTIRCSLGEDEPGSARCGFVVERGDMGYARVAVTPPWSGEEVILVFEPGTVSSPNDVDLTWGKQDDNWFIGLGGEEFYIVPEAVITGG